MTLDESYIIVIEICKENSLARDLCNLMSSGYSKRDGRFLFNLISIRYSCRWRFSCKSDMLTLLFLASFMQDILEYIPAWLTDYQFVAFSFA